MRKLVYVFLSFLILTGLIFGNLFRDLGKSRNSAKNRIQANPQIFHEIKLTPSVTLINKGKNAEDSNYEYVEVVNVVDGDTIEVDYGDGNVKKLRYIGIDTPESVDPRKPIQCFSKEAAFRNRELVLGKKVRLEKDVSETDKYGRLLRYVYTGNVFVNKILVEEGYASVVSYPPDVKYQNELNLAEQQAREKGRGLWRSCADSSNPNEKNCRYSCSNPDRDCADFSSHEEAQEFFNCCGFTVQNDPMNLDKVRIGDGVACENI